MAERLMGCFAAWFSPLGAARRWQWMLEAIRVQVSLYPVFLFAAVKQAVVCLGMEAEAALGWWLFHLRCMRSSLAMWWEWQYVAGVRPYSCIKLMRNSMKRCEA